MVEAEFGQNLRIWKKCIKMVYRESKSFFSKPKLYQSGIFLFVVLLSSYISAVIKLSIRLHLSYFPNEVPIIFSSCVWLPSWRWFPRTPESESTSLHLPSPTCLLRISGSFLKPPWKQGFCSVHRLVLNTEKHAWHRNSVKYLLNKWIPFFAQLQWDRHYQTKGEIYHWGQTFRNGCHS